MFQGAAKPNDRQLEADAAACNVILVSPDPEPEQDFELWSEHVASVDLFSRVLGQWRTLGESLLSLDYGAVLAMAQARSVADLPAVLDDLQVMEVHARPKLQAMLTGENGRQR